MDDSYYTGLNGSGDNFGDEYLKQRNSAGSNSPEEIRKAVEECVSSSSSTLDVSRKNIKHLTEEMYKLPDIKHFHLEGNAISMIPEDLFQKLPHLVWLDLRFNKITALPPGIGYHRQLKTLLLERNPIKELPTELVLPVELWKIQVGYRTQGSLTSLTALNLRHCPLEFPPKDVIEKGVKSILCFLRASGNDRLPSVEPATSVEIPPVEKLNLSELLQSSLDVSDDWPNEEEKLRFQKLKEEIIKDEREEFLADQSLSAIHDFTKAQKNHGKNRELYSESAGLCRRMSRQRNKFAELLSCDRTIQAKRDEKCRSAAGQELKEEQALFKQRKNVKEMLQDSQSYAKWMKEKKETFRFSPTNADTMPQTASYGTDNISYYAMKEGPEKQKDHTPEKTEQGLLKVKDETTRSLREKKMEQGLKWHTRMVKAREKLRATPPEEKQDLEMVEDLQTKLAKLRRGLPLQEYRFTAFTGEFLPDSPGMQTKNIFSNRKF
ncbi:leucine-rich repeat-containing protein 27 [Anser cygnoides]|uniref:leucine-rich repeat-containing protein 27 n=1 Tax=Anser cygnoides TaxID=8845 RepID=UPI0034D1FEEF